MEKCPARSGTYQCQRTDEHDEHAAVVSVIHGKPAVRILRWGTGLGERWTARAVPLR